MPDFGDVRTSQTFINFQNYFPNDTEPKTGNKASAHISMLQTQTASIPKCGNLVLVLMVDEEFV